MPNNDGDLSDEILELVDGEYWSLFGKMKNARKYFGLSLVNFKAFETIC